MLRINELEEMMLDYINRFDEIILLNGVCEQSESMQSRITRLHNIIKTVKLIEQ